MAGAGLARPPLVMGGRAASACAPATQFPSGCSATKVKDLRGLYLKIDYLVSSSFFFFWGEVLGGSEGEHWGWIPGPRMG